MRFAALLVCACVAGCAGAPSQQQGRSASAVKQKPSASAKGAPRAKAAESPARRTSTAVAAARQAPGSEMKVTEPIAAQTTSASLQQASAGESAVAGKAIGSAPQEEQRRDPEPDSAASIVAQAPASGNDAAVFPARPDSEKDSASAGASAVPVAAAPVMPPARARDWGWLGVFGLLGLAGLAGYRRRQRFYQPSYRT